MVEPMDGRRAIAVVCALALVAPVAGCGGSKKSSASAGSNSNAGIRGAPAPNTTTGGTPPTIGGQPGSTAGRRFIATTNGSCARAGRGKPKTLPPKSKPALALYARQALGPAAATLQLLRGLKPPADARAAIIEVQSTYQALVPALQQTAGGGPTALPAQALATLETEAASVAGATGLVACAPYGR
jgi:hypothetical protein